MRIPSFPFTVTDWAKVPETVHPGTTGEARWRTLHVGDIRVRMVRYSPGYAADHWCEKGHVLLVLEGELETELVDGQRHRLTAGMTYQVSDGAAGAHRSSTQAGARLFIVD